MYNSQVILAGVCVWVAAPKETPVCFIIADLIDPQVPLALPIKLTVVSRHICTSGLNIMINFLVKLTGDGTYLKGGQG